MKTSVKVVEVTSGVILTVLYGSFSIRPGKQIPPCVDGGDLIKEINITGQSGKRGQNCASKLTSILTVGKRLIPVNLEAQEKGLGAEP